MRKVYVALPFRPARGDLTAGTTAHPVIDSHCHLASDEFAGDLDAVVDRACGAG